MDMVFANRLREIRERSGMKRKEVAEKMGITLQAYSCYEYGRREPRLSNIVKLSKIFDIPVDVLCSPYSINMTIEDCSDFINSIDGCGIERMTNNHNDYLVTIPFSPEYPLNLVMSSEDVVSLCQSVNGSKTAFIRAFKNRYMVCAAKYANTNKVIYW